MQRTDDGFLLFSPSDLTEFLESPFASWMSRAALDDPTLVRVEDPTNALLAKHGDRHETEVLERLRDQLRLDVVEIERVRGADPSVALEQTRRAVAEGADVIFQAYLATPPFAGFADFLVHPRVAALARGQAAGPDPAASGPYELWDAKLARSVKPSHLVQLCAYADLLQPLEGVRAEWLTIALGDGRFEVARVEDCFHHYRALRQRFLEAINDFDSGQPPLPRPSEKHRGWEKKAEERLLEIDHPTRVARLTAGQAAKLAASGIETMRALAETEHESIPGVAAPVFARLREQARLQRASKDGEAPAYRVLSAAEVQPGQGLASLPPADPGDVYFDIEGYPLGVDGSLEYLWGVAYHEAEGTSGFRAFWAHDPAEETAAFESFLEWLLDRLDRYPALHVYHYASYERTAIKRLAARSGRYEAEVDTLLRSGVFIDLYTVVRHGVRIGEPRYGLKNVERLYRGEREDEVADAMGSVLSYEQWIEEEAPKRVEESPLLQEIETYNRIDCESTLELAEWLRGEQRRAAIVFAPAAALSEKDQKKLEELLERRRQRRELVAAVREEAGTEPPAAGEAHDRWRVGVLLADLLEFHAREARPVWWELFERAGMTIEERFEDHECLAGLRRSARAPFPILRSQGYEYDFDPEQETRLRVGSDCVCAQETKLGATIDEMDLAQGTVVLKWTDAALAKVGLEHAPEALCLIRFDARGTEVIEGSVERTAREWLSGQQLPGSIQDLLVRRRPRFVAAGVHHVDTADGAEGNGEQTLRRPGEPLVDAALRLIPALDGSALCIQGPPGSGKTTLAGCVIAALAREGHRIGVASLSHNAIGNLLHAAGEAARAAGDALRIVKVASEAEKQAVRGEPDAIGCKSDAAAGELREGTVLGGTAWCMSRLELEERLDFLFVDEAGQVSLANVVAMARCARNLVLLGDPAQLAQPLRGTHPGDSGQAALGYALAPTDGLIDETKGLFLADSYRMHPEICGYISDSFYAGRLAAAAGNEKRVLLPREPGGSAVPAGSGAAEIASSVDARDRGIVFLPVPHEGNRQASREEVDVVRSVVDRLVGRRLRDRDGSSERKLTHADIIVVAPYNLQVQALQEALPRLDVGTVDRFQGRQAPVVIVSLSASDAAMAPRGLGFLLARDRLNVAVSRAQTLAVVVGSPGLGNGGAGSVAELEAVNRFWGLVEAGRAGE